MPPHAAPAVSAAALTLIAALWLPGALRGTAAKPLENTPRYGLVIQIPPEFVKAVPLGPNGEPLLSEIGGGGDGGGGGGGGQNRRSFPSLFLSDADTIFGPSFSSHAVSKKVRAKSSYINSDMDAPKTNECEAYCALRKDTHA